MTRNALLLVVALGALRDRCGTDTNAAGVNAPCTRTTDCENGLTCASGVCSPPDAGVPDGRGGANDAGTRDGNAGD